MAGVNLPNMLSLRTFIAKVLGMLCMLSSGMSLGKEGPFVHIAGCLAELLYEHLYKKLLQRSANKTLRHEFYTAAVAVGVTCTFGAPIGGVLFAIEVSTNTFTVQNLWKSFFASTITVLCFKAAGLLSVAALFTADASYFYTGNLALGINSEQPFFMILGILCGILGSFYIKFQRWLITKKAKYAKKYQVISNHYLYTGLVTFLVLNIVYYFKLLQTSDKLIIQSMINVDENLAMMDLNITNYEEKIGHSFDWSTRQMLNPNEWALYEGYLILFLIQKFFFTALTLSCHVPGGIFMPTFSIGSVFG